jgi:hypothetical protein
MADFHRNVHSVCQQFYTEATAAHVGICDRGLRITSAGKPESSRPSDVISLYRHAVPAIVIETSNTAYAEELMLIRRIDSLMDTQDRAKDFADYITELRLQFKPKRNLVKLLDNLARSEVVAR